VDRKYRRNAEQIDLTELDWAAPRAQAFEALASLSAARNFLEIDVSSTMAPQRIRRAALFRKREEIPLCCLLFRAAPGWAIVCGNSYPRGRKPMTTYVALVNWTDQGMRDVTNSPNRLDAARKQLETMGGRFTSFHMTMGEYDLVLIYEAPDDAVATRFILMLGRQGYVRTKTLKAFPEAAYREIIASID
jgi:uncharacterized protein with GYD domain